MKNKIIDFLLENANPSIKYRIKKEVLDQITESETNEFLNQILNDKNVKIVTSCQKADGWLGNNFHGPSPKQGAGMFDNMEVGLRFLAEKGIPSENEIILKAISSFLTRDNYDPVYQIKEPKQPADDYVYTGAGLYLARSSVIIRAGYENILPKNDKIDLAYDVKFSLKTFLNVLDYFDENEVLYRHRGQLCFKHGTLWPCIYHLRMLAFSNNWRNVNNITLLADNISRLYSFPQSGEGVYTNINGFHKGPCMPFIHTKVNESLTDESVSNMWFDRMELFARCAVVKNVEKLKKDYEILLNSIDESLNLKIKTNSYCTFGWSPYFGISLEDDWKSKVRKKCDILFRILLIIHYAENSK